jgi:hypothetical protein
MSEVETAENQNTSLATKPNAVLGVNMRELSDVAALIFNSKVFGDIQTKEAAAIKVIAGMEFGFSPFQSMSMFDFIQGRPTLNAHGKATLINSSGDFRLKINELTSANCSISVVRKSDTGEWKIINTETFSIEDARIAELTNGKNAHSWKKYPRNMLFARCVSNIWRWDTAELNMRKLLPGQIQEFEAEELDAESAGLLEVNETVIDGEIIEAAPVAESPARRATDTEFSGPAIEAEPVFDEPDHVAPEVIAPEPEDTDAAADASAEEAETVEAEPIDEDESKLADLRIAVKEALVEKVGSLKGDQKVFLRGREIDNEDAITLGAMLADLNAM